ncbi:MAG TPA: hypothetical protein VD993_08915 [Chitinophagaceae bacterium]|nr:hypothetical protein [Chitinophagaceae bacterium]
MEKNFMINIEYEGRQVYANVFEYKRSPAWYHVHFIDHIELNRMTLHEKDGRIIADPEDQANPDLIQLVIEAIEKNPNRI